MLPYLNLFDRTIPMYGLCIVCGVILAFAYAVYDGKKKALITENILIIGVTGIGAGFVGAKILYVFVTFTPAELAALITGGKIGLILNGGFVFYGGLIFGIFGACFGAHIARADLGDYENTLIKSLPIAHMLGRIGCFFAGCCYGKPTARKPWIVFKQPLSDAPVGVPLIPTQIYEAGVNLILFLILSAIDKYGTKNKGLAFWYILLYSAARFMLEFLRYDSARGIIMSMSVSQWISIALFIIAVFAIPLQKTK